MTAGNTESPDAPGRDDLRARYLPVSRRELRRLREAGAAAVGSAEGGAPTASTKVFSEDGLAELQELNEAVATVDDPSRVDPELLKKQQAVAARAMQANQERIRQEQVEADRDLKERGLRPESAIITRKTLRTHMDSDEPAEPTNHPDGSIEPVQARGAHGLDMDAMVEHSTRQGTRQSMMNWLVIILAVLLIIALGVVLSFIL